MATILSNKDQFVVLLAVLIIYLGVFTLRSDKVSADLRDEAMWAGFLSITLGIFALLSLLFNQKLSYSADENSLYPIISLVALVTSAFFNIKLLRNLEDGGLLKTLLWLQVGAHVGLVFSYWNSMQGGSRRGGYMAPSSAPNGAWAPRIPVRA